MKKLGLSLLLLAVLLIALSPSLMTTASDGEALQQTHQLVRISQLDPKQYRSTTEYQAWASSTCSTAAMTEVMNSYGHSYHITDVLAVESSIGAITHSWDSCTRMALPVPSPALAFRHMRTIP